MWDVIQQIKDFPLAESIHGLQGYICGALAVHGLITDKVSFVLCAILVSYNFISYESLEQARIHDNGDSDVMVFWAVAFITGLLYFGGHKLVKRLRRA